MVTVTQAQAVLPADLDNALASSGIVVIVQPSLVFERGDHYLLEVDPDDMPFLHRHGSLLAAGIPPSSHTVSIVQAAMPVAITPFALAGPLELDREFIARSIVLSTVLSAVTLPLWISLVGAP